MKREKLKNMYRVLISPVLILTIPHIYVGVVELSRLFVYYNERWIEDDINEDSGAEIRDGIKSIVKWGACKEILHPYDVNLLTKHPSNEAYLNAMKTKIKQYARVNQNITDIKMCLFNGNPIVFGFTIYDGFNNIGNDGILNMPTRKEHAYGGHAALAVGYDDSVQRIIVQNCWGETWGDNGYFYMPYGYLCNEGLSEDLWAFWQEK